MAKTTRVTKAAKAVGASSHATRSSFRRNKGGLKPKRFAKKPLLQDTEISDTVQSLRMLQSNPTAWLDGTAIDVGSHFHLDQLPNVVQDEINYTDTWPTGLWNDQHRGGAGLADFNRVKDEIIAPIIGDPDFITRIRERQYTIWPTNVGHHWVVIIIRTTPMTSCDEPTNHNGSSISHIAVVDPARHQRTIDLVHRRMRVFLEHHRFTVATDSRTDIWLPKQRDNWSCGDTAYYVIKVMLQRIKKTISGKPDKDATDLWGPLSEDFQPSKTRTEIIGLLADVVLPKQKYTARTAIGQKNRVKGNTGLRHASKGTKQRQSFVGLPKIT